MYQLSHDRLPFGQSSHLPVRITPAVRTRGWYFQFAFCRLAISQFANYLVVVFNYLLVTQCYTEDSCRPAIIDSRQKQRSQISFHALSFQKI